METPEGPVIDVARYPSWKKLVWRSFGFGAGTVVSLAAVIGCFIWYSNRPAPLKPWNAAAVTAEFDSVDTDSDHHLVFYFTLQNNSDQDFKLADATEFQLGADLNQQKSFSPGSNLMESELPVFIPARGRVRYHLTVKYPCPLSVDSDKPLKERRGQETTLAAFVSNKFENLRGFTMYDSTHRYKISFPNGWVERAKHPPGTDEVP